ncbi:hypothetical protein P8452_56270 [Trifolium repens]|nr:hypothetical protein P8452_56270 [Trifolium repens]
MNGDRQSTSRGRPGAAAMVAADRFDSSCRNSPFCNSPDSVETFPDRPDSSAKLSLREVNIFVRAACDVILELLNRIPFLANQIACKTCKIAAMTNCENRLHQFGFKL